MRDAFRERLQSDTELDDLPDHALLNIIQIPRERQVSPWALITRRVFYALLLLTGVSLLVYLDKDGYNEPLTFIDAVYYSAVSLSTVGYGDITPVTQEARLINIILITPIRIAFLILLVGTTLSVLTEETRRTLQIQRWRKRMRNHTVVVGYGTKGRSAVSALLADGVHPSQIVVVDTDTHSLDMAAGQGLVTVHGSATKADVLKLAGVTRARAVVVAPNMDDTAVLVTLSVREIAPSATIVASVRESENLHLLKQSGADSVVISSETAGRMLGLATVTPSVVEMMEDLLSPGEGFSIAERLVEADEVGANPRHLADIVLGVVRSGELYRIDSPEAETVEPGDMFAACSVRTLRTRHVASIPEFYACVSPADQVLCTANGDGVLWLDADTARTLGADLTARVLIDAPDSRRWAVRAPLLGGPEGTPDGGVLLTPRDVVFHEDVAQLVYRAVALLRHRERYRFDPMDGTPLTYADSGEYATGESGHQVFPRIDPAVIGIVEHAESQRILLGSNAMRPEYFSLVAGYVSVGETLEQAFVREVMEETGRRVADVRYVSSQPWPLGSSLMMGFHGYSTDLDAIAPTDGELAEVRWFSAPEILDGVVKLAPAGSIAHHLIYSWAHAQAAQT